MCNNTNTCLEYLKEYENHNAAVGDSFSHISTSSHYSPEEIYCFDERESLITYQVSIFLEKSSEIVRKINGIIRNSFESGLFSKWKRDTLKFKQSIEETPPIQMTLENLLMPVIFILGIGIPISVAVFLLEHLVSRKMKQKIKSGIWFFLDNICNPDRLYFRFEPQSSNSCPIQK